MDKWSTFGEEQGMACMMEIYICGQCDSNIEQRKSLNFGEILKALDKCGCSLGQMNCSN